MLPRTITIGIISWMAFGAQVTLNFLMPTLLVERGYSITESLLYTMIMNAGSLLGACAAAVLAKRAGRKVVICTAGILGCLTALAFALFADQTALILILGATFQFFGMLTNTTLAAWSPELYPTRDPHPRHLDRQRHRQRGRRDHAVRRGRPVRRLRLRRRLRHGRDHVRHPRDRLPVRPETRGAPSKRSTRPDWSSIPRPPTDLLIGTTPPPPHRCERGERASPWNLEDRRHCQRRQLPARVPRRRRRPVHRAGLVVERRPKTRGPG